jgi:hypothetical protein
MTVQDLIEYLQQQPVDAQVRVWSWIIEQDCRISHVLHLPEQGTVQIYTDEDDI